MFRPMKSFQVCFATLLVLNLSVVSGISAQKDPIHLVPLEELRSQLMVQSAERMANIQEIRKLLNHEEVQKQVGRLFDLERVDLAVATLDDAALSQLAEQSRVVNDHFEAGMATWGWVVIAAIAAITIIAVVGTTAVWD